MQFIKGILLHRRTIKTKKGQDLNIVSILDQYKTHSQVVDITDFDNFLDNIEIGQSVEFPFRSRPGVSDRGNTYINYVTAGQPV